MVRGGQAARNRQLCWPTGIGGRSSTASRRTEAQPVGADDQVELAAAAVVEGDLDWPAQLLQGPDGAARAGTFSRRTGADRPGVGSGRPRRPPRAGVGRCRPAGAHGGPAAAGGNLGGPAATAPSRPSARRARTPLAGRAYRSRRPPSRPRVRSPPRRARPGVAPWPGPGRPAQPHDQDSGALLCPSAPSSGAHADGTASRASGWMLRLERNGLSGS